MNASTLSQSSQDPERMGILSQIFGYILEPLLHAAPYPYIALHPVLTAARHVQYFETSTSPNGDTRGIMSRSADTSLLSVIYPRKGVLSWLVWSFSQILAQRYLTKSLSMHITECVTAIVFAPLHVLWLHSALSDAPIPMKASTRYIRSVTAIQWLRFIVTVLASVVVEESIEFMLEQSFQMFIGYKDFMAALDTDQARYLSTVLAAFYFLSKAVKLFLWVPATVAAVQAVPKLDAEGPVIDASTRVVDTTFHINVIRGGLEDSI
ncbi:unnamed protein product [Fusarium equiseti]|uniref:Uncharacterized protein n=1 Tax=Fusarium equiseti TaxID=61235 RepID=A0A8J2JJ37_FUSEQ|nr:unnamed protein product [Fusarium equiseti]